MLKLSKKSTLLILVMFTSLYVFFVGLCTCTSGEPTLIVCLPDGKEISSLPDPWLNGGWLLTFNETSWHFKLVIKQASSEECYKTHLVIALNDVAYRNLITISINGTNIPKFAFKKGVPKPFGVWTWPDDIYPAWFNDTMIQLGTIEGGHSVEIEVYALFSNITGVKIHFDAYGKLIPCNSIPSTEQIVWSPNEKDSTVSSHLMPPITKFHLKPDQPIEGEPVIFNATESYDPDGEIFMYTWSFGDGTIITVDTPVISHTFSCYGNYTVCLTVTDTSMLNATISRKIYVRGRPHAWFTFTPQYPFAGQNVTFSAVNSEARGGHIVSYLWDFGDGIQESTSSPYIFHSYGSIGDYTVTLTVIDSEGLNATTSKLIMIRPKAPKGDFYYLPSNPLVNQTITFNASISSANGGYIVKYYWDFGDGNKLESDKPVVTHTYSMYGYYNVSLVVVDSENLTGLCNKIIHIIMPPNVSFIYSGLLVIGEEITFNASARPNGGTILWYYWDFGDGSHLNTTEHFITHIYSRSGTYNVTLTVYDSEQLSSQAWIVLTITAPKSPSARFKINPAEPLINQPITFDASISIPGFDGVKNCTIVWYYWDFGDGSYLNTSKPVVTHTYTMPGEYNVGLKVFAPSNLGLSSYIPYDFISVKVAVYVPVGGEAEYIDKFKILLYNGDLLLLPTLIFMFSILVIWKFFARRGQK